MTKQENREMATQQQPLSYYLELDYPYTVVPDDGSYFIRFPDLPGCITQVDNGVEIAEAAEEIRTLWIEGEYEDGAAIPEPSMGTEYSGKFQIRLPKSLHRALVEQAQREGMSLNAYVNYLLAERNIATQLRSQLLRIEGVGSQDLPSQPSVEHDVNQPGMTTTIRRTTNSSRLKGNHKFTIVTKIEDVA